ncbi:MULTISPECIES: periplasmic nitrate reductase, NapE protein [Aliagarivorans]|uniref:periplasmic nitrate reductase, NapE protein n=1 Tax=Aliagarivorans TaxID=882379 RepID=UPI00041FCCDF|nr:MULTISPECIES: periplasmic nitrate reductase, NapE protein [Aliagarivorans]
MESTNPQEQSKRSEWLSFLIICVFLFPILSVVFVGGYGFIVWMLQLIYGPPGHSI